MPADAAAKAKQQTALHKRLCSEVVLMSRASPLPRLLALVLFARSSSFTGQWGVPGDVEGGCLLF